MQCEAAEEVTGEKSCCAVNLLQLVCYAQVKVISRPWLVRSWCHQDHIWTRVLCGCLGVKKGPMNGSRNGAKARDQSCQSLGQNPTWEN